MSLSVHELRSTIVICIHKDFKSFAFIYKCEYETEDMKLEISRDTERTRYHEILKDKLHTLLPYIHNYTDNCVMNVYVL